MRQGVAKKQITSMKLKLRKAKSTAEGKKWREERKIDILAHLLAKRKKNTGKIGKLKNKKIFLNGVKLKWVSD